MKFHIIYYFLVIIMDIYLLEYFVKVKDNIIGERYISYDGKIELLFYANIISIIVMGEQFYATSYRIDYEWDCTKIIFKRDGKPVVVVTVDE